MFKTLGKVAVCGLALYGLAKLISECATVVAHDVNQAPDPFESSPDVPENAASPQESGQPGAQDPTALAAEDGGVAVETPCASDAQAQHPSDATQAAPCP